jgi:HK97 gp10 family phage protein
MADGVKLSFPKKTARFQKLRKLDGQLEIEMRKAVDKSAAELVETAQKYAPVDDGTLRESIDYQSFLDRPAALVKVGAFYAHFLEFGTVKAAAQPFFWPSYRILKRRFQGRFSRALNAAAKRIKGEA